MLFKKDEVGAVAYLMKPIARGKLDEVNRCYMQSCILVESR